MLRLSSIGWRNPTYLPQVNHALWWGAFLELREVMEPYVSLPDDTVLGSIAPPEGFLEDQLEMAILGVSSQLLPNTLLKGPLQRKQPPLGGLLRNFPDLECGANQGVRIPNSVPWVEGSVASLQASYCCQTGPSDPL